MSDEWWAPNIQIMGSGCIHCGASIGHYDGCPMLKGTDATVGWICARCGKSLAPWVRECDCKPPVFITIEWENPTEGVLDVKDQTPVVIKDEDDV